MDGRRKAPFLWRVDCAGCAYAQTRHAGGAQCRHTMKWILFLVRTAATAVVDARQVYRCAGSPAHYRDTLCPPPPGASVPAPPALAPSDTAPFLDWPQDGPGGWNADQPVDQRLRAQRETLAMAARVLAREQSESNRKEVQYAENRARCKEALRVADLCGKFEGLFECDEKGFRPVATDPAHKPAAMDGASRYEMDRCARAAERQGP